MGTTLSRMIGGHDPPNCDSDHHDGLFHDYEAPPAKPASAASKWGVVRKDVQLKGIVGHLKAATATHNRSKLIMQVLVLLVLGCVAVIPSELIVKRDPNGMELITISNFVFAIVSS